MSRDYRFIIDTEQHAGNFERDLCAYVTAQLGECGVGDDMARIAQRELPDEARQWFDQRVRQEADEHGCFRPVKIVSTPGWFNTGMGCCFRDGADPDVVRAAHLQALRSCEEPRFRAFEERAARGDADAKRQLDSMRERLARAEARGPSRYPAFLSVAILLDEEPPSEIAVLMRERSLNFAALWPSHREWHEPVTITGFRLA